MKRSLRNIQFEVKSKRKKARIRVGRILVFTEFDPRMHRNELLEAAHRQGLYF